MRSRRPAAGAMPVGNAFAPAAPVPAVPAAGVWGFFGRVREKLRSISYFVFFDFPPFDPTAPDDPAVEAYSNAYRLSRFLRLVRLPFLTLLALPALLPSFFVTLPRFAPIVLNIQERTFLLFIQSPDVTSSPPAYLFALAIWLVGLWLAVMIVKGLVRISEYFHSGIDRPRRSVVVYLLFAAGVFGFMASFIYDFPFQGVAPGAAILALLGLLALLNASLIIFVPRRLRLLTTVLVLIVIALNNRAYDSYRFENLDYTPPTNGADGLFKTDLTTSVQKTYVSDYDERRKLVGEEPAGALVHSQIAVRSFVTQSGDAL